MRPTVSPPRLHRGYTLIELVVAMTVAAVLVAIALPSFQAFAANQSIRTASYTVTSSLILTRSEAVKRNAQVTIAAVGGVWTNGWTVTSGGQSLLAVPALTQKTPIGASAPPAITFDGSGRVVGAAGQIQIPLSVQAGGQLVQRCITLDVSGMPKTVVGACA